MRSRALWALPLGLIVVLTLHAVLTAQPGQDYFWDASPAIDALVRGDLRGFFAEQPLMGSFSLLVRAPFVAPVFHMQLTPVYFAGVLPCLAALVALAAWVDRRSRERGHDDVLRAVVLVCLVANPMTVRAIHWGHPEELLATALALAAILAAARGRGVIAGVALGLAITTKQWAVVAAVPAALVYPGSLKGPALAAVLVALALTLPMLAGNPDRFFTIAHAASGGDTSHVLGLRPGPGPGGTKVTPANVWWLLPGRHWEPTEDAYYSPAAIIARISHPLIVLMAVPLGWLAWRRRRPGRLDLHAALTLLAVLFALRGVLDPMSLDYYHVPLLATLGALAAFGTRRDAVIAAYTTLGLSLAFAWPDESIADLSSHGSATNAVYLVTITGLLAALAAPHVRVRLRQPRLNGVQAPSGAAPGCR